MDLDAAILPLTVNVLALLATGIVLAWSLRGAGIAAALRGHAWPAMLVAVLLVWQMRAVTDEGPALHLLGAALLQLCFGWRLALFGVAAVLAAHTADGSGAWGSFGVNFLLLGALPVALSHAITRAVNRRAPENPFVYILVAGFAGAGMSMLAVLATSTLVLVTLGSADPARIIEQFTLSGVLVVFPEAFVTGAVLAPLAMFCPHWVATWDPPWARQGRS